MGDGLWHCYTNIRTNSIRRITFMWKKVRWFVGDYMTIYCFFLTVSRVSHYHHGYPRYKWPGNHGTQFRFWESHLPMGNLPLPFPLITGDLRDANPANVVNQLNCQKLISTRVQLGMFYWAMNHKLTSNVICMRRWRRSILSSGLERAVKIY